MRKQGLSVRDFQMKKFYSCGIPYLDNLIGGVLLGDNVVWVLEPGTYFDYFGEYFLTAKDAHHFKNIYVSFDFPPQKICSRYRDFSHQDDFILVDAFTFGKGQGDEFFQSFYKNGADKSRPSRIHCIKNLMEPTEFIETIGKLQGEEGSLCKYIFESLTGMQELWGEEDTLHFFTYTCPKLFELKALAYWPMALEAHSRAFLANISHITQLVIHLGFQEEGICTARFLKMEGRPSQLLNVVYCFNFQDNKINFLEPPTQADTETRFERGGLRESGPERVPSFLRKKDPIRIGGQIRRFRLEKNLSQVELARILNITPSALSQIENNQSLPSLQLFVDIARSLGKSLDSFFFNASPSRPPRPDKSK